MRGLHGEVDAAKAEFLREELLQGIVRGES
jgi:hypothetical protein